jgi:3-deoxy-D-manno-octulosonate 8-phosphate phosphatase (KDO 8-P phosphatase)
MAGGAARVSETLNLQERCLAVELLVVDVDGVLTDGGIVHGSAGLEIKAFHVRDGFALRCWHEAGKRAAVVTGRSSPVVEVRAREVGIGTVIQGAADKLAAYRGLLADTGLSPRQVCYVGDDLPDLPPLCNCGLAVAVADAAAEVRAAAHHVTRNPGGRAAVREAVELILRCQGTWQRLVDRLRGERL